MSQQPPAVHIRSASAADEGGIDAVIRAAFGATEPAHGDQVGELWAEVRAGEHLLAEQVAVLDGEIVGHVGISHCWIDARRELIAACMLSPLSTSPGHQERGIGTDLVPAATYGIEAPTRRVPSPAFQVVPFALEPWMTGRVVYPEVWWRHDPTGLRGPRPARIEAARGLT